MGKEEKYLKEINYRGMELTPTGRKSDLKNNYEDYDDAKVADIIDTIDIFVARLEDLIDDFPIDYKFTLKGYKGELMTAKEKNKIRDHIDGLKTFDLKSYIKSVIW
jgi:hypothetical protein